MRKIYRIALPVVCFFTAFASTAQSKKATTKYVPKFEKNWAHIDSAIKNNWEQVSGRCGPGLTDTFVYSFWCNVQFYWDTYFTQVGLLKHNKIRLAKGGINNLLNLVDSLGFAPNANADWGSNRSQPPYLSMMVKDLYPYLQDKIWLQRAYRSLLTEYRFWTDTSENAIEKNYTNINGLQRYFHHASNQQLLDLYNPELTNRFGFSKNADTATMLKVASYYAAEAETGMDFTTRFEHRCPDFVAVDLNSNLYLYELNFAWMEKELGITSKTDWLHKAASRKALVNKYCWSEKRGTYLDYDFINKRHSKVAAVTMLSPLYAGIASAKQAKRVVAKLPLLEGEWGLTTTEASVEKHSYQWDHFSVWAPLQTLAIIGLDKYGYKKDAKRIAAKWLDIVAANFEKPDPISFVKKEDGKQQTVNRVYGKTYEKYTRNGKINDREYNASVLAGWTAGAYALAYAYLNK